MRLVRAYLRNADGATAVEYGLIAALVAISLFAALGNYYDIMTSIFGSVSNGLNSAQH